MIAQALVPVIFIVVGVLLYVLPVNGKVQEIGRLTLAAGLFALAFAFATNRISIG